MQKKIVTRINRDKGWVRGKRDHDPPSTPPRWRIVERGPLAGLSFLLPGGRDAPWADAICAGGYEEYTLAALRDLAMSGGVLYDIGAHIGFFTCAWIRLGGERVEAFEPLRSSPQILRQTIERNNMSAFVRLHNIALGDYTGIGQLVAYDAELGAASAAYFEDFGKPDSLVGVSHYLAGTARPVQVRRPDDIVSELVLPRAAVLKIDVESAESPVLAGAVKLLDVARPVVLREIHRIESAVDVAHRLASMNYRMRRLGMNRSQTAYLWSQIGIDTNSSGETR